MVAHIQTFAGERGTVSVTPGHRWVPEGDDGQ